MRLSYLYKGYNLFGVSLILIVLCLYYLGERKAFKKLN